MYYTDDPIADFNRWDRDQERKLSRLPKCVDCGDPIQDEDLFDVNGDLFCGDCMIANFRRPIDNYVEE